MGGRKGGKGEGGGWSLYQPRAAQPMSCVCVCVNVCVSVCVCGGGWGGGGGGGGECICTLYVCVSECIILYNVSVTKSLKYICKVSTKFYIHKYR